MHSAMPGRKDRGLLVPLLQSEEGSEPGRSEVHVRGENLGQPQAIHDGKRDMVDDAGASGLSAFVGFPGVIDVLVGGSDQRPVSLKLAADLGDTACAPRRCHIRGG